MKKILLLILLTWFTTAWAHDPTSIVKLRLLNIKNGKDFKIVTVKMTFKKTGKPVTPTDLVEEHTQKIHLLIIDNKLEDYSHIHPVMTKVPGVYEFKWRPKTAGFYRLWADIIPAKTNSPEVLMINLTAPHGETAALAKKIILDTKIDGIRFRLKFNPSDIMKGQAAMGTITVTKDGIPFGDLQPVMGAYAHIVGFSDDFKSAVHVHPMGAAPQQATDMGGPEIIFHLLPEKAGYVKIFAQVKIDDKEIFVPFEVEVHL
jgi:hypothetical protein